MVYGSLELRVAGASCKLSCKVTVVRGVRPMTHDMLRSWSTDHNYTVDAVAMFDLDNEQELCEATIANDTPVPGEGSNSHGYAK